LRRVALRQRAASSWADALRALTVKSLPPAADIAEATSGAGRA